MPKEAKDHYTTKEAAKLLGVAVSTVQLWTNNGLLRAWKTGGGHRRITRQSINDMLNEKKAASNVEVPKASFSVVIVEDDDQLLLLYKKQFLNFPFKFQIETAKDGFDGMIKIGKILPDVIITDLKMPNMDGFQMIRSLKDNPELSHSLMIVITGLQRSDIDNKGGLPSGVHLFTKPFDFSEILPLLNLKAGIGKEQ